MENINDKMLTYAALLFILAIVGIITLQWLMAPTYAMNTDKVLHKVSVEAPLILPDELQNWTENAEKTTAIVLAAESKENSLPFAKTIYIPFDQLLESKSLKQVPDKGTVLLFGKTETQAMMALQLLLGKGYKNVRAVANDLEMNKQLLQGQNDPRFAFRKGEKASFDYGRLFKTSQKGAAAPPPASTEVVKTKGGC